MMEPAAPGTEDEVKSTLDLPAYSKKASEQERLLSVRTRLPSGKYGNVFELSFLNGSEHWYCNLCECPIMGRVYHHEIGKRHTSNMQVAGHYPIPTDIEPEPSLQIAPGEPVPPGFENEIRKIAQIQERLDSFTVGPLIGLEYLLEIQEYEREKEPAYLCMLCDKRGDPRTVIAHLASYNHISQYMQRHFTACYRALSPYITKQYKRNWQATMQKVAEAIENKFGRLKPHVIDRETFDQKRIHYQAVIGNGPHFSEKSGFTFEELIIREQLTKNVEDEQVSIVKLSDDVSKRPYRKCGAVPSVSDFKDKKNLKRSPSPPVVAKPKKPKTSTVAAPGTEKRRSLSSVSSISSSDLSDFEPSVKEIKQPTRYVKKSPPKRMRSRSRSPYRRFERRSRSRSPPRNTYDKIRERDLPPWQRSDYMRPRQDVMADNRRNVKNDKFDEFKKLATAIENDMDKVLKQHGKNPEKHPQYNDEWKKFWNRRYKELQTEGKDAANYDFKPEWIEFWNKRMVELHGVEVKTKKDALRKRLGLPEEPAPICFKITGKKKSSSKEDSKDSRPTPMAATPDQDPDIIIIEDKDDDTLSSKRSHSPWETEPVLRSTSRLSKEKNRDRASRDRSFEKEYQSRDRDRDIKSRDRDHDMRSRDRDRDIRSRDRETRSRERSRDRDRRSRDRDYGREYSRNRSHERQLPYYREARRKPDLPEYIKPPRVMRDVTRHPVHSPPLHPPVVNVPETEQDDDDVNIVGVLRLLTALEEKLGSLGPKVIDLLGQALAMEKNEANSAETLLDNDVNCVLFETVKEKLKGQLLAGLVEYAQEKAFKNAIRKIASVIHFAGVRKKLIEKERPKVDPVKVPGVGTVDKAAIAKQIATALILQGKTDVTQVELEQLINAVVGMAEASRNSSKPMTTASFLEQLSGSSKPSETKTEAAPSPTTSLQASLQKTVESCTSHMEGLSDSDLQTLLQNFKDLSTDEQHGLISYLKKLEAKEPERVERLRKFVNLDSGASEKSNDKSEPSGRSSPFSSRMGGVNPTVEEENLESEGKVEETELEPIKKTEEKPPAKVNIDSEDEDYSFEDVFKAARKNVKQSELEKERKLAEEKKKKNEVDLTDAKALIANLMGQFGAKNASTGQKLFGLGTTTSSSVTAQNPTPVTSTATSLAQTLSNFDIPNLAGIVSNARSLSREQQKVPNTLNNNVKHDVFNKNHNADEPRNTAQNILKMVQAPFNMNQNQGLLQSPVNMGQNDLTFGSNNSASIEQGNTNMGQNKINMGHGAPVLGNHPQSMGQNPLLLGHPQNLGHNPPLLGQHPQGMGQSPSLLGQYPQSAAQNQPLLGQQLHNMAQSPSLLGQHAHGIEQSQPNVRLNANYGQNPSTMQSIPPQTIQYPIKNTNVQAGYHGGYQQQNITYPQQNPYRNNNVPLGGPNNSTINQPDRYTNAEYGGKGRGNNSNHFNRPGDYGNYGSRW